MITTLGGSVTVTGQGSAAGGTARGVHFAGGRITVENGDITITGTGGGNNGLNTANHGVHFSAAGTPYFVATGSGRAFVYGTGGTGQGFGHRGIQWTSDVDLNIPLTMVGVGGGTAGNNDGFSGSLENNASVTISGIGGSGADGGHCGIVTPGIKVSGTANLSLTGLGGGQSGNNSGNRGISLSGVTSVQNGVLIASATGGGAGTGGGNYGIAAISGATITSSGSGALQLIGLQGGGDVASNFGFAAGTLGLIVGTATTSGPITLMTDAIGHSTSTVIRTSSSVAIMPYTPDTTVGVAGGAGALDISTTVLANITSARMQIGSTTVTGTMTLNSRAWAVPVTFAANNGGNIVVSGSQTTSSTHTIDFFGPVTLSSHVATAGAAISFSTAVTKTGAGSVTVTGPTTVNGDLQISAGTLVAPVAMSVGGNWLNSATFAAGTSTVTFSRSSTDPPVQITGSTTFYALRALTGGTTLAFTPGTTQYVINMVEFRGVELRSTGAGGTTWYFSYSGSSQTLRNLRVQDSNASANGGLVMSANDGSSIDLGNNSNWEFVSPGTLIQSQASGNWFTPASWVGGLVPVNTDRASIMSPHVVTATAPVTISSVTIASGGSLKFDANQQAVTLTILNGGKLCNYGTVEISTDTNAVAIQAENGGSVTFEGTDIDFYSNKVFLGRMTYQPAMSLASGEAVELSGNVTLGGTLTTSAGASFVMGSNNTLTLTGTTTLADGTFSKGTGTARVKLNGDFNFSPGTNNLGDVSTGP
jgi:hypothetical protein